MRPAASSIALGVAEGMYSRGGNRAARYHTALGSARETMACLEVAVAMGYLDVADPKVIDSLSRFVGTLVRLVQRLA
jgi:four helix bundle protein